MSTLSEVESNYSYWATSQRVALRSSINQQRNQSPHTFLSFRTCVRISRNYWRGEGKKGPGSRGLPVKAAGGGGHSSRAEGEAGEPGGDGSGPAGVVDPWQARPRPRHRGCEVGSVSVCGQNIEEIFRVNSNIFISFDNLTEFNEQGNYFLAGEVDGAGRNTRPQPLLICRNTNF